MCNMYKIYDKKKIKIENIVEVYNKQKKFKSKISLGINQ